MFKVPFTLTLFRSTGSYEPDLKYADNVLFEDGFDPQALTSLTHFGPGCTAELDGFDPQALTSLTDYFYPKRPECVVSIHRLLRA